jgi:hypothetical protein
LAFEILRYFPTVDIDNNFKNIGIHGVYDSKFDRIIITKLDYIPQPTKDVFYDDIAKEFYVNQPIAGDLVVKKYVQTTDLEYFCNKSWTASFNFITKSWVSFHTYLPNFYIGENGFFYSGLNEGCDITAVAVTEIPSPTTTTTTTIIIYCNLTGTAVVTGYPCALEGEVECTDCTTTTTTTTTPAPTSTTTTTSTSSTTTTTTPAPIYNYYTFTPCVGGAGTDYRSILSLALNDVYAFQASPPDRACYTITSITAGVNSNNLPTIYGPKSDCNDDDCQQP